MSLSYRLQSQVFTPSFAVQTAQKHHSLAVVLELKIRIVAIPYTPTDSATKWYISTYGAQNDLEVVIGNNDVHFMSITKQ